MNGVRPPLVAVLAASAVTLILVGRSGGPLAAGQGALRSMARAAFVPAEAAAESAFRRLEGARSGLDRAGDAARAEAVAGRERERAESEAARADAIAAENARLVALLGLDGPSGGDGVAARVVSTGFGATGAPLVIDRGGAVGIRPGMPVVAAGGLVGRVVEVAAGHSTVLPLTAAASAVGVRAGSGAGVAQGRDVATLGLDLLDPAAAVQSGDLAVTAGLRHSRFPAGLPVGRVTGSRARFGVEPFAPPNRLEVVKVLRWVPES
jgi:rod shape-determining protein MreC